jgi:LPXTG-motif cell wall-anchored protein
MLWLILLAGAAAAVGTLIYVRRKNREEDEKAA